MSCKTYLLKFKPLEPYFFGEEKNIGFDNLESGQKTLKNSYYIKSGNMPSQSTIIGAIRYLVLKQTEGLSKDGVKLSDEQKNAIGSKSFNISSTERQEFGKIKSIGPVHIAKDNKEYYRAPYCFYQKDEALKCFVIQEGGKRDGKNIYLPDSYDPKKGLFHGFIAVDDNSEISFSKDSDIFESVTKTRILKEKEAKNKDDSFFKKECKLFKDKSSSFCCEVEVEDWNPETDIVYMGQDKSPFSVTAQEKNSNDCLITLMQSANKDISYPLKDALNKKIKGCIPKELNVAIAISDVYFSTQQKECIDGKRDIKYENATNFAITTFRNFRYMTSEHEKSKQNYYSRLKKSDLYHLAEAGSVFFMTQDEQKFKSCYNENLSNVGLNTFIFLKGDK